MRTNKTLLITLQRFFDHPDSTNAQIKFQGETIMIDKGYGTGSTIHMRMVHNFVPIDVHGNSVEEAFDKLCKIVWK